MVSEKVEKGDKQANCDNCETRITPMICDDRVDIFVTVEWE